MADKKADKQKDAITKALAEANDMTVEEYLWMKKNMEEQRAKRKAAEAKIQAELDRSARLGDKGPKQVEKTSKLAPKTSPRPKPRPKNK